MPNLFSCLFSLMRTSYVPQLNKGVFNNPPIQNNRTGLIIFGRRIGGGHTTPYWEGVVINHVRIGCHGVGTSLLC